MANALLMLEDKINYPDKNSYTQPIEKEVNTESRQIYSQNEVSNGYNPVNISDVINWQFCSANFGPIFVYLLVAAYLLHISRGSHYQAAFVISMRRTCISCFYGFFQQFRSFPLFEFPIFQIEIANQSKAGTKSPGVFGISVNNNVLAFPHKGFEYHLQSLINLDHYRR